MMTTISVIILDASVLINFLTIDRVDLLTHFPGHQFVITAHVAGEVIYPDQAARLATAILNGDLRQLSTGTHAELATFARLAHLAAVDARSGKRLRGMLCGVPWSQSQSVS